MGFTFEEVTLDMIGRGGQITDLTAVEQVERAIRRVAQQVLEPSRADRGSVTLTVTVEKSGEDGVTLGAKVKTSEPATQTRALSAMVDDGELVAAEHRQEALDFENVAPFRGAEGGE